MSKREVSRNDTRTRAQKVLLLLERKQKGGKFAKKFKRCYVVCFETTVSFVRFTKTFI